MDKRKAYQHQRER